MAFMAPPAAAGSNEDRIPVLGFNAKAGRLFLHDRMQQPDGEWITVKTDVTMAQPAFAVDFGRLETGWIHFSPVGPQFSMAFYGQPIPAQPDSPGNNANGKALRFKAGFRVPVIGQAIGGLRDFRGNAGALINGMNELHTQYEESGEARAGQIPLVKMTNVIEVQAGQSSNFQPVFSVVRYVDRLVDLLGPRTVAPPGAVAAPLRTAPPRTAAPPVRAAATRIAAPETRYAPPSDRWDDERWDAAVPARVPAAASTAGWMDDEIPF
jgi:hypothetical protein